MALSAKTVLFFLVVTCAASVAFGSSNTEDGLTSGRDLLSRKKFCGRHCAHFCGKFCKGRNVADANADCIAIGGRTKCKTATDAFAAPFFSASDAVSRGRSGRNTGTATASSTAFGKNTKTTADTFVFVTPKGSVAKSSSSAVSSSGHRG